MKESKASQEDLALKEMTGPTAREAHEQARDRTLEKQEHLCELSRALAVLASASSVSREREEFLSLVNKEGGYEFCYGIGSYDLLLFDSDNLNDSPTNALYYSQLCHIELYNSMVEKEGTDGEKDVMKAYRAAAAAREESDNADEVAEGEEVSSALIERVDAMLQNLEQEIDDVDAKIGDRWRLLDSQVGKVPDVEPCHRQRFKQHFDFVDGKVHDIPIRYMTKEVAENICDIVEEVQKSAGVVIDVGRHFIRVRVKIDITLPLCRGRVITLENGSKHWVRFRYERLPNLYFWCGRLNHANKSCELWLQSKGTLKVEQQQYNSTLKAAHTRLVEEMLSWYLVSTTTDTHSREKNSKRQGIGRRQG
ncbi:hypothetical protein CFP56_002053 [Quercus suber]|uniref:Zinc knuckle CX2CX4HX4C domain-containing protein n=1 Tax=Quercus suber TaxID=58331 RepID=A0AAW0IKC6_QUESU